MKGNGSVITSSGARTGASLVVKALRLSSQAPRAVFGSAVLASAAALLVGGVIVAGAFVASWGLFLQARRAAEFAIESEDSYVAYADQWSSLVKVALCAVPLLLVVAVLTIAWLGTMQTVAVAHEGDYAAGTSQAPTVRALWSHSRQHFGAALRVHVLILMCVLVPALAALSVLVLIELKMVPGVVWPTYHDPATTQFILVGRILPVVIWLLGLILLARFSLATAVQVADNASASAAMRRSWTLTRTARLRSTGICLLCSGAVAIVFTVLKWLGTFVAHWAGLLMLATTDDNVWVTGVLVTITPMAIALVLLPFALAPVYVLLACLREHLDGSTEESKMPSCVTIT